MTDSPWKRPIDFTVAPSSCPSCGAKLDAATQTLRGRERPKAGDVSICLYCAAVNQYGDDLQLVAVTGDELTLVLADPDVKKAIAVVRQVMARR